MGEDIAPRIKHPESENKNQFLEMQSMIDEMGGEGEEERKRFGISLIKEEANKFSQTLE